MAYESQQIHCPVCREPNVTPGEHVQTWDNTSAHWCNDQSLPDDKPKWSHRIPFHCKSGCHFTLIIEQSERGTVLFTADHVMTWEST